MTLAPPSTTGGSIGLGALFQLLRDDGPHTRAELAARTGLARSTVKSRIDALLASDLLTAAGEAVSTGGRPPAQFSLNPLARIVIAVDLGATHVSVAATDLRGRILAQRSETVDIGLGPAPVLDRVAELAAALRSEAHLEATPLAGIGIGVPGPVEHATGRPTNPPIMPGWDGFDVPARMQRTFDAPVLVDNDVNVMAIGEYVSSWPGLQHLLFVKVATGIGAGIISDGRINRGAQGAAGDLGHVQVPAGGHRKCRCGNVGCLEAMAAGPAMVEKLQDAGLDVALPEDVVELVRSGDLTAIEVLRQAGRDIGGVLTGCVSLLNPSVIVIGGRMAAVGEYLLAGIREVVYRRALPLATHDLRIVTSRVGGRAGVVGAAAMVIDSVLSADSIDRELAQSVTA
jgi:predicted NBD/HSP70 family sugar kinase